MIINPNSKKSQLKSVFSPRMNSQHKKFHFYHVLKVCNFEEFHRGKAMETKCHFFVQCLFIP